MAARLFLALAAALAGGAAFRRFWNRSDPASLSSPFTSLLKKLVFGLSGFWLAAWLTIAALRFHYPFELEWNSGAMRDHCARLLAGQPLFAPPSADWIPYFYSPLYVQICALIMRLTGGQPSYEAMRAVSIAATLGSGLLLFAWTRWLVQETERPDDSPAPNQEIRAAKDETNRRVALLWGGAAAGLFFAAYRMTGAWYDIERLDSLFLFWALLGGFLLEGALAKAPAAMARAGAAGLIFALAVLTKQQAILFLIGGGLALAWRKDWPQFAVYAGVAALVLTVGIVMNDRGSEGWFWRYMFVIPLAQGIKVPLVLRFLFQDMPLYGPSVAILACCLLNRRRNKPALERPHSPRRPGAAALVITGAALLISLSSRAHWGGYENVLMPAFAFTGFMGCVAAGRLEITTPRMGLIALLLILAQFAVLAYRPDMQIPIAQNYSAGIAYEDAVRRLEREGTVLSFEHGGFTATPHLHSMSLYNFLLARQPVPESVRAGFLARRYAVILTDSPPDANREFAALTRGYMATECLNLSNSWVVTGLATPSPDRPVWVLRPIPDPVAKGGF